MNLRHNRVEDTNDSAAVSKHSMATKGYVFDPFLRYFISDNDRRRSRSPLINRFYYLRFKAIEYAINQLNGLNQIISIGCGFDTSSLRLPNISFIEIDLPLVAINKAKVLVDNQLVAISEQNFFSHLNENDKPFVVLKTKNYCLIGADLRKYRSLKQLFTEENILQDLDKSSRICLFNECSLCYLKQETSDNIIRTFVNLYEDKCQSIVYLGFEQLKPNQTNDGLSKVMLKHFQTIGSPLKTFLDRTEIIDRFRNLDFKSIQVLDMKTFFDYYISGEEKRRIDSLEMFDEYEEFDSVSNCYALTVAQRGSEQKISSLEEQNYCKEFVTNCDSVCELKSIEANLLRFGHSSCLTSDHKIIVFGGFGCDSKSETNLKANHKRLTNIIEIDTKTNETIDFHFADKNHEMKGIHSQIVELEDRLFLVSGGRLSPNTFQGNKIVKLYPKSQIYEIQSSIDSMPKVFRHLVIKLKNSQKLIALGGKQSVSRRESETNSYNVLDAKTLQTTEATKRNFVTDIHSLSGTALDSNVWLTNGGLNCDSNTFASNDLNLIDERMPSNTRIEIKGLNHLYSHQMKCLDEKRIAIIGGISKLAQNNRIELIDLRNEQIINSIDVTTDSTLMLTNFSSELIHSDSGCHLCLIGGGGNCFSFGTHFNRSFIIDLNSLT